jgi:hypothetical protein
MFWNCTLEDRERGFTEGGHGEEYGKLGRDIEEEQSIWHLLIS